MKKHLITAGLLTLSAFTAATFSAPETASAATFTQAEIKPYFIIDAGTATVTQYYTNLSQIPDSIYYTDYHPTWGDRWGTLYLQNIVPSGNGYKATFYGSMSAQL